MTTKGGILTVIPESRSRESVVINFSYLICYNAPMAFIYILTNATNSVLYIGVTNNLIRRVYEHRTKVVTGFTERYHLNKLIYYEHFADIAKAIEREKTLKKWNRGWKERLINEFNPTWRDLYEEICF